MVLGVDLGFRRFAFSAHSRVLGSRPGHVTNYNSSEWSEPAWLSFQSDVTLGTAGKIPSVKFGTQAKALLSEDEFSSKVLDGRVALWPRVLKSLSVSEERARLAFSYIINEALNPAFERVQGEPPLHIVTSDERLIEMGDILRDLLSELDYKPVLLPSSVAILGNVNLPASLYRCVVVDWGGGALRMAALETSLEGPNSRVFRIIARESYANLSISQLESLLLLEMLGSTSDRWKPWGLADQVDHVWSRVDSSNSEGTDPVVLRNYVDSFVAGSIPSFEKFGRRLARCWDAVDLLVVTGGGAPLLDRGGWNVGWPDCKESQRLSDSHATARGAALLGMQGQMQLRIVERGMLSILADGCEAVPLFSESDVDEITKSEDERTIYLPLGVLDHAPASVSLIWGLGRESGEGRILTNLSIDMIGNGQHSLWAGATGKRIGSSLCGRFWIRNPDSGSEISSPWEIDLGLYGSSIVTLS